MTSTKKYQQLSIEYICWKLNLSYILSTEWYQRRNSKLRILGTSWYQQIEHENGAKMGILASGTNYVQGQRGRK